MAIVLDWTGEELCPGVDDLLRAQGVDPGHRSADSFRGLAEEALELLRSCAEGRGTFQEISRDEFAEIYPGTGNNAESSPLAEIYPRAKNLALFALTLGAEVSGKIDELFEDREFPLASMLDSAASEGAEIAATRLQAEAQRVWNGSGAHDAENRCLRYSPGYCGWHVSGQGKLFEALDPGRVGITLRPSFLMEPLKSISGVIVGGEASIHDFDDDYLFCVDCESRECRNRILSLNRGDRHDEDG